MFEILQLLLLAGHDGIFAVIALFTVTTGVTASAGFRFFESDRHLPCPKLCLFLYLLLGVAGMGIMTRSTDSSLVRFIDMAVVQIEGAVAETGLLCCFLKPGKFFIMAIEAQGIGMLVEGCIESARIFSVQEAVIG